MLVNPPKSPGSSYDVPQNIILAYWHGAIEGITWGHNELLDLTGSTEEDFMATIFNIVKDSLLKGVTSSVWPHKDMGVIIHFHDGKPGGQR